MKLLVLQLIQGMSFGWLRQRKGYRKTWKMNKINNITPLICLILLTSCAAEISQKSMRSYSVVESVRSGKSNRRSDSVCYYLNGKTRQIDSIHKYHYMLGAWHLEESDSFVMPQKKAHDQIKTAPYRDEFGLFEILNINVSLEEFQQLYNNSNAQKESKDRTLLIFTNTSDNILTGYQSSARDEESVGLNSVLYEHKDSLLQLVIFNFSNDIQEIQSFLYTDGRIEHITREWKEKDSTTFAKDYKIDWHWQ